MDVEVFEFEPGRWSYKVNGAPSGETFPSRAVALIASEQAKNKQVQAPVASQGDKEPIDPQI